VAIKDVPADKGYHSNDNLTNFNLTPTPTAALPADVLTEAQAILAVTNHERYAHLDIFGEAEKVIYDHPNGTLHRTWKFYGSGGEEDIFESFEFFVDTNSGEIVRAIDAVLHADVSGTVRGWATPGTSADTPSNPPVMMPLPGSLVNVIDTTNPFECPGDHTSPIASEFADSDGQYSATVANLPVQVDAALIGRSVRVHSCEGHASFTPECWLGVIYMLSSLEDPRHECITVSDEPGSHDIMFDLRVDREEFDTAQNNAFIGITKTYSWLKNLHPEFTGIDKQITVLVNATTPYFASYNFQFETIEFTRRAFGRNNWAYSTIVSHEYSHFILDQLLEPDVSILPLVAFHEAIADTVAAFVWDTAVLGEGAFVNDNPRAFARKLDEPNVRLNDCDSLPEWCTNCNNAHCLGLALGGAFWDMRQNLIAEYGESVGKAKADRIFTDFLFVTSGRLDESVLLEVLLADDDDGDLSNFTPHSDFIRPAFTAHGWGPIDQPPQTGQVKVAWVGPLGVQPEEGVDYVVHSQLVPPHVTLKTTIKNGDVIQRWIVGRQSLSGPSSLGRVSAVWDGQSENDIIIQIGDESVQDLKCSNLHIVDAPTQAGDKWSGVVLELHEGELLGRAQAFPSNTGAGGRIRGTVLGRAQRVLAQAIGVGESPAATSG
jgi:hypothetical protein